MTTGSNGSYAYESTVFPISFETTNYNILAIHRGSLPLISAENASDHYKTRATILLQRHDGFGEPRWPYCWIAIGF